MRHFSKVILCLTLAATSAFGLAASDPAEARSKPDAVTSEVLELRELIRAQARQLEEQRQLLEQEQRRLRELEEKVGLAAPAQPIQPTPATSQPSLALKAAVPAPEAAAMSPAAVKSERTPETAPLSVKIGSASFTPGGFFEFNSVFRSTNVGSGVTTTFGSIPFNNTPQGNSSETRASSQTSRLSLKIDSDVAGSHVLGYYESDFCGNQPTNQYVTSNSYTFRMRMLLADLQKDKWEVVGGQAWTMITPARRGLGMMPSELLIPQIADANYHVGFPWARQAQVRMIYHPSTQWSLGMSAENPEQYIGTTVVLPSALSSTLSGQFDTGSNSAAPNSRPDLIAKIAYDGTVGSHALHVEAAGLARKFRDSVPVGATYHQHAVTGGAGALTTVFGAASHLNLVASGLWSDGGGRYTAGLGPDLIVRANGEPSLIHSGSGFAGFEWQMRKTAALSGYYGATYYQRNTFVDTTGKLGGFGFAGSSNASNRAIQEATISMTRTFWKAPNLGALQAVTQASYVTRSPWYVAPSSPRNARSTMGFAVLRYVLP